MIEIILRAAGPGDAEAVARLATQLGYPTSREQAEERLRHVPEDPARLTLVALREAEVAGWMDVAARHTLDSEPYAEIVGLVVDEQQRGARIGEQLVAAGVEWARQRGVAELRVRSNVVRLRAHRFYERLGFATRKSQKVFAKAIG
ncbi:MAG: GNAT family N-acetyltransferase [Acidobacteriota bacterium]